MIMGNSIYEFVYGFAFSMIIYGFQKDCPAENRTISFPTLSTGSTDNRMRSLRYPRPGSSGILASMTGQDHCLGVHMWYPANVESSHNLRPIPCRDYVAALEQLVQELGGDPQDAILSVMDGEGSDTRLNTAEPVLVPGVTPVGPCSRCRRSTPAPGHRWCADCVTAFVHEVGANEREDGAQGA